MRLKIEEAGRKIFESYKVVGVIWFGLVLATVIHTNLKYNFNNYHIFEGVFWHTIKELPLYVEYPQEYFDSNHYGILFSAVIAPFAVLPDWMGVSFWILGNSALLFFAIKMLPMSREMIVGVLLIGAHDMYTAAMMQQFNPSVIALLVLAFVFVERGKSQWATLFIVIGFFVKLYGIVGLAFFFFAKDKWRFVWSGLMWLGVLFVLPMVYSSWDYVVGQYEQWADVLMVKNGQNMGEGYNLQNLSLLGFLQRTGIWDNNMVVILVGLVLFCLPYLRIRQYKNVNFRMMFLASVSMFLCLFSTGTENSTWVIGFVGVGIWYVASPHRSRWWQVGMLVLAILASLSPTDIFKPWKKDYIIKYSLRAVPVAMIWLTMIYQMCFYDYKKK